LYFDFVTDFVISFATFFSLDGTEEGHYNSRFRK